MNVFYRFCICFSILSINDMPVVNFFRKHELFVNLAILNIEYYKCIFKRSKWYNNLKNFMTRFRDFRKVNFRYTELIVKFIRLFCCFDPILNQTSSNGIPESTLQAYIIHDSREFRPARFVTGTISNPELLSPELLSRDFSSPES